MMQQEAREMVRAQVQLSEAQHRVLREEAFRRNTSISAIVRELVDDAFRQTRPRPRDNPAAWAWLGCARDSAEDVAEHHDAYLTGERE
jgi:hypothetical protein